MQNIQPNRVRARVAIAMIGIIFLLEIFNSVFLFSQWELLQQAASGTQITPEAAETNDRRVQVISSLTMVSFLVSVLTFLLWFKRAADNLRKAVPSLSFPQGYPVFSWFIPIYNLYKPFLIAREMHRELGNILVRNGLLKETFFSESLLTSWWVLWIAETTLNRIAFYFARNASTLPDLLSVTNFSIYAAIVDFPLCLITIALIWKYSTTEELLSKLPPTEEAAPPA